MLWGAIVEKSLYRRGFGASALALAKLCGLDGAVAIAQTVVPLPQTFTMSPGGVDLKSGQYYYRHEDLSSGDLTLTRTAYGILQTQADEWPPIENGFDHNFRIGVVVQRVPRPEGGDLNTNDWLVTVHLGAAAYAFKRGYQATDTFVQTGGVKGRALTWSGGGGTGGTQTYTFTDRDSTVYVFRPTSAVGSPPPDCGASMPCGYVASITKPNGDRTDFEYDHAGAASRLRLVRSNHGYAIGFEYSGLVVTKACAINLSTTYFAAGNACPSGAPAATYAYANGGYTYTSPAGGTYIYTPGSITLPGAPRPWLTWTSTCCNDDGLAYISRQDFADGSWWTYAIGVTPLVSTFTGPNGTTTLQFDRVQRYTTSNGAIEYIVSSGPSSITDPLGRTTRTQYCGSGSGMTCVSPISPTPLSQTLPEGDTAIYTNDNFDTPTSVVLKAKPGGGLSDRTISATYAYSVPGGKTKPLTITDANRNVTTFTYDAVHGGVLTETGPAVGGISPVKRYGYAQRYAWVSNGSGGYVPAATPVWLLIEERSCRTTATVGGGCAGGAADEVLVSYDYGPNSGPNNLLLRGKVVSADGSSLCTCYGYDAQGNKIWETSPRAGLSACY